MHKAIRRIAPAPRTRYTRGNLVVDAPTTDDETDVDERTRLLASKDSTTQSRKSSVNGSRETTLLLRRRSSTSSDKNRPLPIRSNTADLRQHLKHLGPSNVASRPKATKYTSVKIKPGVGTIPEGHVPTPASTQEGGSQQASTPQTGANGESSGGHGSGLLGTAGVDAKNGARAVAQGYGTISPVSNREESYTHEGPSSSSPPKHMTAREASAFADSHTSSKPVDHSPSDHEDTKPSEQNGDHEESQEEPELPQKLVVKGSTSRPISRDRRGSESSHSTLEDLEDRPGYKARRTVRSGSITENIIDVGGMKKVVLEANSSSDGDDQKGIDTNDGNNDKNGHNEGDDAGHDDAGHDGAKGSSKKKKKKKRAGKKFRNKGDSVKSHSGDSTPLLR